MNIAFLLNLIAKLGDKLPKAWPHIIHIAADVKAIAEILSDGALQAKAASDDAAIARCHLVALGLPTDEIDEVVSAFDA